MERWAGEDADEFRRRLRVRVAVLVVVALILSTLIYLVATALWSEHVLSC